MLTACLVTLAHWVIEASLSSNTAWAALSASCTALFVDSNSSTVTFVFVFVVDIVAMGVDCGRYVATGVCCGILSLMKCTNC
jgi:hypothetical protein